MPAAATAPAAARPPTLASIQQAALAHLSSVRVTGTLTEPARLDTSTGAEPAAFLHLRLQPPHGLPYTARLHLGRDVVDRMHAESCLPYLVTGALVSVAGRELQLQTDHGHAALRVVGAHALVIPDTRAPLPINPQHGQEA